MRWRKYGAGMRGNPWWDYVEMISDRAQQKDVATATGIDASTVSRWSSGKQAPSPKQVVTLARAYRRSPLEGLIAAGFLSQDEAGVTVVTARAEDLTPLQLVEALREKLLEERDAMRHFGEEPAFDAPHLVAAKPIDPTGADVPGEESGAGA